MVAEDLTTADRSFDVSSYVHEREFAKDSDFFAQPDQVVVLNLETANEPVSENVQTGKMGEDLIRIRLEEKKGTN